MRSGRSTSVPPPQTNPLYHLTHCFEAKSNKSPGLHSRAYLNTPSRQTFVDLQSGVGAKPVWPDGQVPSEETIKSSYRTTVATSSSIFWPFPLPLLALVGGSSDTVFSTNVFKPTPSSDSGYSAMQTSQNCSRMSEATPPLPPLPHCVAVGKYRQMVFKYYMSICVSSKYR